MAAAAAKKNLDKTVSTAVADLMKGKDSPLVKARAYARSKRAEEFDGIRVKLGLDDLKKSVPHIPSGSMIIDYLIGGLPNSFGVASCPGFPRGRVSQIWGHEAAGKTTLCLTVAAQTIREGGTVLYVDWENDIVPDYAMALGIPVTDETKFELLQPDNLEDGIKYALIYAAAGVDLIVFDSIGAAISRRLTNRDLADAAEQSKIGENQVIWSQELPNLKRIIARTGTAVIGISQVRANIGAMGNGPKTTVQGGNAWKFFSSVRLELRRVQSESANELSAITHKVEERVVGSLVNAKAVKCKMSRSQGREEVFFIRQGQGIDNVRTILEIAVAHGLVKKAGSWVTWVKPDDTTIKVQGLEKLRAHLLGNEADLTLLHGLVKPLLGNGLTAGAFRPEEGAESVTSEDEGDASDPAFKEIDGIFQNLEDDSAPPEDEDL